MLSLLEIKHFIVGQETKISKENFVSVMDRSQGPSHIVVVLHLYWHLQKLTLTTTD